MNFKVKFLLKSLISLTPTTHPICIGLSQIRLNKAKAATFQSENILDYPAGYLATNFWNQSGFCLQSSLYVLVHFVAFSPMKILRMLLRVEGGGASVPKRVLAPPTFRGRN